MTLSEGTRLGRYEIVGRAPGFGTGEVYEAIDPRLGRDVAIKIVNFPDEANGQAMIERAMSRAVTLYHPNIGAILEFHVEESRGWAVLERYDGVPLKDRLGRGRLPWRDCAMIGTDLALGLAAAHEREIAHGKLGPESIFLGDDGRARILDFGAYEMESVGFEIQARDDRVALGRLLFEAATGHPVTEMESPRVTDSMRAGLQKAGAPERFIQIVDDCLRGASSADTQSARELALELRSLLTDSGAMLPTLPGDRSRPLWAAGAILLVLAVVIGLFILLAFGLRE